MINFLWCLTYFQEIKENNKTHEEFVFEVIEHIKIQIESYNNKDTYRVIPLYELILLTRVAMCVNNLKFRDLLNLCKASMIENLRNFTLVEFLTIYNSFVMNKAGSLSLYSSFF